jgi:peroxiredoxin-like protein
MLEAVPGPRLEADLTEGGSEMSIVKPFEFSSATQWRQGEQTLAIASGRPMIGVGAPPEFRGSDAGAWSPEELLVSAAASCLSITLAAVGRARGVELERVDVEGVGRVEQAPEGGFRFTAIELLVEVEASGEHPHAIQTLVEEAERRCIVSRALDVPVSVRLVLVRTADAALSG